MPLGVLPNAGQVFCEKCRKTMSEKQFYTLRDGSKMELCKACLTMHVNNWEPETYLWILEKADVPYIEAEWVSIRDKAYQKDPYKITGMSVVGKYLAKMKLIQWKDYRWADTERLKTIAEEKAREAGQSKEEIEKKIAEMQERYERGEISEAQFQTYKQINTPAPHFDAPPPEVTSNSSVVNNGLEKVELPDLGNDLTEEDKIYLALKWGRLYTAEEWVSLEQLYEEFMNTFDIQGAARIDTLKMICKTSLKMNQAIDSGDIDAYQKLSRVYDAMMKSAKFTEAQNKEGNGDFVDSVGQLVAYCEKEGGQIPKYTIDAPKDIVDSVITDLKRYNKSLIYEDKSLAQEIEQYLKNKQAAEQMKKDREAAQAQGLEKLELEDQDYAEYRELIAEDIERDKAMVAGEEEE